jgi:hypothetical protein
MGDKIKMWAVWFCGSETIRPKVCAGSNNAPLAFFTREEAERARVELANARGYKYELRDATFEIVEPVCDRCKGMSPLCPSCDYVPMAIGIDPALPGSERTVRVSKPLEFYDDPPPTTPEPTTCDGCPAKVDGKCANNDSCEAFKAAKGVEG